MREHIELVYILQKRVKRGIVYFFRQILFRAILFLTLGCLDNIYIFFDLLKYIISVFYMREHIELVYTPKQSKKWHCIILMTDYIHSNCAFNTGVPR